MAARYWVGGGSSANWNATGNTNWSDTSGGANNFSVPTSTDDVTFDANGNSNSTISATITVLSLTITSGYTATMTHNAVLTIAGNWTMNNTHTIAGSSGITLSATCTITSNGQNWPNLLTFSASGGTITLVGDLTITGSITNGFGTTINKTTTEKLYTNGVAGGSGYSGTADIYCTGGTINMTGTINLTNSMTSNLYLAGNVTVTALKYATGTITYSSGTISASSGTVYFLGSCTVNASSVSWGTFDLRTNTQTLTLASNISVSTLLLSATITIDSTVSETISCSAALTVNGVTSGTAKIILTGGTWSGSNTTGIANNLDLQGNVTVSGNVYYRTGTLTYVSGTITVTSSTLNLTGSCTLNTNGMSWNTIVSTTATITLTSNLTVNGNFSWAGGAPTITLNRTTTEEAFVGGLPVNGIFNGTAKVTITGGTWSAGSGGALVNLTGGLYLAGDVTFGANVRLGTNTSLNYVSGIITTTGSVLTIHNTATLNIPAASMSLATLYLNANTVTTLASDVHCTGSLISATTGGSTATINRTTTEKITVNGITPGVIIQGTAHIYIEGGIWSDSGLANGISSNFFIDGNITISGSVHYRTNTLTYVSGVISGTGTLNLVSTCTLDGGTYYNIVCSNTTAQTYALINNPIVVSNILQLGTGAVTTFAGTVGFIAATLSVPAVSAITINLKESVTYTITTLFSCFTSRVGSIVLFTSSHASTRANILLPNNGSNLCNVLASFTRISAAGGRSICTFGGTISDCINVVQYYDYPTVAA